MEDKRIDGLLNRLWAGEIDTEKVYGLIQSGSSKLMHNLLVEKLILDDIWINQMETGLRSIEQIVRTPKKSIYEDSIIVPVEKSKKVNERSIQHLARHSENVKTFDNGVVNPKSVLTPIIEEDLAIYENRFLFCLINRASQFIDKRYKTIERHMKVTSMESLSVSSSFNVQGAKVKCALTMDIKEKPDNIDNAQNLKLVARASNIRRRLALIKKSEFYMALRKSKPVYPPIVKTNILTKNVDYNNAYKLWVFLSGYDQDGFEINVKNKNLGFDDEYAADMLAITSLVPATAFANNAVRKEQFESVKLNPLMEKHYKVVSNINYRPTFELIPIKAAEDTVNQFYYEKMRVLLGKSTGIKKGEIIQEKNLTMPFAKFFTAVAKISDSMYKEILEFNEGEPPKKADKLELKRYELNIQEEVVKRYKLLIKLKESELAKTIKDEVEENSKLEILKWELDLLENKKRAKDVQNKIALDKEARLKETEHLIQIKTEELNNRLSEEERIKIRKRLESASIKVNEEREMRERELLQLLKEKYENV